MPDDEHAVIVHIPTASTWPTQDEMKHWHAVQERLDEVIAAANAGVLDGDEWGQGQCTIFCYGPDADRLWSVMRPVLLESECPKGAYAIKRYGGPDCPLDREARVDFHEGS